MNQTSIHPQSLAEAKRLISPAERLVAFDRLHRVLIPGWQVEFALTKKSMTNALPGALKGSLRDLATFIIACRANENICIHLQGAENHAAGMHPMSQSEFGS